MWRKAILSEVRERVDRLPIPFNNLGLDPLGISKDHLGFFYSFLVPLYRHYFRVLSFGTEHVPSSGRAMIIGNHSGGLPFDAGMVMASLFFELDPPRHAHGMVEKFAQNWPIVSPLFSRVGQLTGLPEHANRILEEERMLLVFPEGVRGIGKLYKHRYELVRFGTGFMRIALRTETPVVPFAFVGAEEAYPTVLHLRGLAKLVGAPYVPVPAHIIPFPLPLTCSVHYGEPMRFKGTGTETDDVIEGYVEEVREKVAELIEGGRAERRRRLAEEDSMRQDVGP